MHKKIQHFMLSLSENPRGILMKHSMNPSYDFKIKMELKHMPLTNSYLEFVSGNS